MEAGVGGDGCHVWAEKAVAAVDGMPMGFPMLGEVMEGGVEGAGIGFCWLTPFNAVIAGIWPV